MFAAGGPLEGYIVRDACGLEAYARFVGKTVGEMAAAQGKHVTDAFVDLALATDLQADFFVSASSSTDPEKVGAILDHPAIMAGTSDGGAHVKFFTGGQFSTDALTWLVRKEGRFTLEAMHHKLSALPARIVGLDDRGTLEAGKNADILVYDYDALDYEMQYEKVYDLPNGDWRRECKPSGMNWVIVNGHPIYRDNEKTGELPGRMLPDRRDYRPIG